MNGCRQGEREAVMDGSMDGREANGDGGTGKWGEWWIDGYGRRAGRKREEGIE